MWGAGAELGHCRGVRVWACCHTRRARSTARSPPPPRPPPPVCPHGAADPRSRRAPRSLRGDRLGEFGRRHARASEAVAGRPDGPIFPPGSAAPPRAARRALRRSKGRVRALQGGCSLTMRGPRRWPPNSSSREGRPSQPPGQRRRPQPATVHCSLQPCTAACSPVQCNLQPVQWSVQPTQWSDLVGGGAVGSPRPVRAGEGVDLGTAAWAGMGYRGPAWLRLRQR